MRESKSRKGAGVVVSAIMSLMLAMQLLGTYAPAALAEAIEEQAEAAQVDQNSPEEEAAREEAAREAETREAQSRGETTGGEVVGGESTGGEAADGEAQNRNEAQGFSDSQNDAPDDEEGPAAQSQPGRGDDLEPAAEESASDEGMDEATESDADKTGTEGDESEADASKSEADTSKAEADGPEASPQADSTGTIGTAPYTFENGALTVGAGSFTISEWNAVKDELGTDNVTSVVFEDGAVLTDSAYKMFSLMSNLVSVDASGLDVSSVTDLSYLFNKCVKLESVNCSGWNPQGLKKMEYMFYDCNVLASIEGISDWDTSQVTSMATTFTYCKNLTTLDLSGWDTKSVMSVYRMFNVDQKLKTILVGPDWTVGTLGEINSQIFDGCKALVGGKGTVYNTEVGNNDCGYARVDGGPDAPGYLTRGAYKVVFDANGGEGAMDDQLFKSGEEKALTTNTLRYAGHTFVGWNTQADGTGQEYTDEQVVKDLGPEEAVVLTLFAQWEENEIKNYAVLSEDETTLTFKWGDPLSEPQNVKTYTGYDTAEYHYRTDAPWYNDKDNVTKIVFDDSLVEGDVHHLVPKSIACWFSHIYGLEEVENLQNLDTSKSINMAWMFTECTNLRNLDTASIDTSSCASIYGMFDRCTSLRSVDVSNWDLSKCRRMDEVFAGCSSLTAVDVSNWNTSGMTTMSRSFEGCQKLEYLDLSGFDCSSVTLMQGTFKECYALKEVDLGKNFSFNDSAALLPTPAGDNLTGKWYYLTKADGAANEPPVGTAMTAEELRDSYDGNTMAGTWVWEHEDDDYSKYDRYSVTYDANGGEGEIAGQTTHPTKPNVKLSDGSGMSREGYTISGWNTKADGSGDAYELGSDATLSGSLELFAQWAGNAYEVSFNKNADEATGTMDPQPFTYGESQKLTENAFEYAGHHFVGWNTQADGKGGAYENKEEVQDLATEDGATFVLYAQWELDVYTVTFNPDGAEMDEAQREQQVNYGEKAKKPVAKREGYVLKGWFEDGAQEAYDFNTPVTGDLALTATWDVLGPVDYIDENSRPQTREGGEYEALTEDASGQVLSAEWYAVLENVTLDERLVIDGKVHLILCDGVTLKANKGVNLSDNNELWVYGQEGQSGTLEATGPQYAAGIGGDAYEDGGVFVLAGGKVTAKGGEGGAGVGGGPAHKSDVTIDGCTSSAGGDVTVYAGELTATGGNYGAGVGGGNASKEGFAAQGGTFKISGGKVVAQGGSGAAGIGSGYARGSYSTKSTSNGGTFEATGGVVETTGGRGGAGIGAGSSGYCDAEGGTVTISGTAQVTATGGYGGSGIGAGEESGIGADVTISGGKVTANGGACSAGIGGGRTSSTTGYYGAGGKLTVTGGEVTATSGQLAAGIGGGEWGDGGEVIISGGEVTAIGKNEGAGIGSGKRGKKAGTVTISGGKVTARAGYAASGIGTGESPSNVEPITLTITGGEVYAYGGNEGTAIGGGHNSPLGTVTISGGKVVADGRYNGSDVERGGAGIGAGFNFTSSEVSPGTLVIEGKAEVTAIGGYESAGIGATIYSNGIDVTIRATKNGAPKVMATGGKYGAGIGGAYVSSGSSRKSGTVAIDGACDVTAIGGEYAAGIGGGVNGPGADVTITGGATVTTQAGTHSDSRVTQAIGHGNREQTTDPSVLGNLTIYPEAKVLHGAQQQGATPSFAANRVADCRDPWAQISPCQHQGVRRTPTQDKLHHVLDCPYCLGTRDAEGKLVEHDHEWVEGADGAECVCGVKAHRVSFDANGAGTEGSMAASDWVIEGKGYAIPACAFTRTGYDFAGWNTVAAPSEAEPGDPYADKATLTMGTADVTLYAQWRAHTYKVAFDKNGGTGEMADQDFTYDAAPTALTACAFERGGYDFAGWNTVAAPSQAEPGTPFSDGQAVKNLTDKDGETVTLYAQWEAHTYTVEFDANGGEGDMDDQGFVFDVEQALTKNAFTRVGYDFAGWQDVQHPFAEQAFHTYSDGQVVKNLTGVEHVTLYARWTAHAYKVAFDKNAEDATGTMSDLDLAYDAAATALTECAFTRTGYDFAGWNTVAVPSEAEPGKSYADEQAVSNLTDKDGETVTLYAQWAAHQYKVAFDKNAEDATGTMGDMDLAYDAAATALTECAFSRTSYDFAGWNTVAAPSEAVPGQAYADKAEVRNLTNKDKETVTLYAQWAAHAYKVAFDANGGMGTMDDQDFVYGTEHALTKSVFTRTGYDFAGWNTKADGSGDGYDDQANVKNLTADEPTVTLYAQWAAHKYKVAFNANTEGATGTMTDQSFTYGADPVALTKNAFSRTGYAFAGWNTKPEPTAQEPGMSFSDEEIVKNLTTDDGVTITLYAQWTVNAYKVAFDANGGKGTMAEQGFVYDAEQALTKNAFARTGYDFAGWNTVAAPSEADPGESFSDGQAVKNLAAKDGATVTLYAQWTAHSYKVTFNKNASAAKGTMAVQSFRYDVPQALRKNAFTRVGYAFAGWNTKADGKGKAYGNGASAKNLASSEGATVTLFAQWKAITFKVAFNKNAKDAKGTMAAQTFTYDKAQALKKNAFTRVGYTFSGWNTKADGKGTRYADAAKVKNLTSKSGATVTLYAQWKAKTYTVTFESNGGSKVKAQKVTHGKKATKPANPKKKDHAFLGWFADKKLTKAYNFNAAVTSNRTLYAKWECAPTVVSAFVEGTGWLPGVSNGAVAGTTGRSITIEALALKVRGSAAKGGIEYRSHVQHVGWEKSWRRDGKVSGKAGEKRVEAVQIRLWGDLAKRYDVWYRVHARTIGWMGWEKNGAKAGTAAEWRRAEAIQVVVVPKGQGAPPAYYQGAGQNYSAAFREGKEVVW